MVENICAVVITYNPDSSSFKKCLSTYENQVREVIIVDNGSNPDFLDDLKDICNKGNITVIYNEENLGIATALNIGVKEAIKKGYDWIITFDHDSEATENMVSKMFQVYKERLVNKKVGIIAPNYVDANTGEYSVFVQKKGIGFKRIRCSGDYIEALFVITSGSLFHKSIFEEVGYFEDDLFIDYVDNEFCLRLQNRGFGIYVITDALMLHRLGERKIHKFGPVKIVPTNHSIIRKYYIERNRIYNYKKYGMRNISWFMFDILACVYDIFKVLLFEKDRMKKLKYIFKGFYHGFIGKYGKLEL